MTGSNTLTSQVLGNNHLTQNVLKSLFFQHNRKINLKFC